MQMETDSSVYYAVTLVSSDAVWLLSHLPVKKRGSRVRGMDCAVSALVTQIVCTLQRNESNAATIKRINFRREKQQKEGKGYVSSIAKIPEYSSLRQWVKRSNDELRSLLTSL